MGKDQSGKPQKIKATGKEKDEKDKGLELMTWCLLDSPREPA